MIKKPIYTLPFIGLIFYLLMGVGNTEAVTAPSNDYPIGVSSRFVVTAGNALTIDSNSAQNGRFMSNTLNLSMDWTTFNQSADAKQLAQPSLVLNDGLKTVSASDASRQNFFHMLGSLPTNNKLVVNDYQTKHAEIDQVINNQGNSQLLTSFFDNSLKTVADIPDFQKNGLQQYVDVQKNMQAVSDYYLSLNATQDYVANSRIQTTTDSHVTYEYTSSFVKVTIPAVINPNSSQSVAPMVTAEIDFDKVKAAAQKAGANPDNVKVQIDFAESADFEKQTDLPFYVLNWRHFTKLNWDGASQMMINGKKIEENTGYSGSSTNERVIKRGSHILNNFPDLVDSDAQQKGVESGQTADTAGLVYGNPWGYLYGTLLIPDASFVSDNTGGGFVGAISAGKNIRLKNQMDIEHSNATFNHDGQLPDITPPAAKQTIENIAFKSGNRQTTVTQNQTATFDYDDSGQKLAALPQTGIQANINLKDSPDKYRLYYRILTDGTPSQWYPYADNKKKTTFSGNQISIPDIEGLLFPSIKYQITPKKTGKTSSQNNEISYQLHRQNQIEFAVTNTDVTANNVEQQANSRLTFDLDINGSLRISLPEAIDFGNERLGQMLGNVDLKVPIIDVTLDQLNIVDHGTAENPKIIVYNPMAEHFHLTLQHLDQDVTNPLLLANNLKYQISEGAADSGSYSPMTDPDGGDFINVISDPGVGNDKMHKSLTKKYLYLELPYSNRYKIGQYQTDLKWQVTAK